VRNEISKGKQFYRFSLSFLYLDDRSRSTREVEFFLGRLHQRQTKVSVFHPSMQFVYGVISSELTSHSKWSMMKTFSLDEARPPAETTQRVLNN